MKSCWSEPACRPFVSAMKCVTQDVRARLYMWTGWSPPQGPGEGAGRAGSPQHPTPCTHVPSYFWGPGSPQVGDLLARPWQSTLPLTTTQQGEDHAPWTKGTSELEQGCWLGFHWGLWGCESWALRVSPHLLLGRCICPEVPSGSHEHCPVAAAVPPRLSEVSFASSAPALP